MKSYYQMITLLACLTWQAARAQEIIHIQDTHGHLIYLSDTTGKLVSLHDFPDKIVVADFWTTGCGGCVPYFQHVILPLKKHFEREERILFISVCLDKEQEMWKRSIDAGRYSNAHMLNLHSGGRRGRHAAVTYYTIDRVPSLVILPPDRNAKTINGRLKLDEESLLDYFTTLIQSELGNMEKAEGRGQ